MKRTTRMGFVMVVLLGVARLAHGQTINNLAVTIEGRTVNATGGGEQPNTSSSSGPLTIGKPTHAAFAKLPNMCGFAVGGRMEPGSISGWDVTVTPTRVDGEAVTLQVHWVRSRDNGADSPGPRGDVDVTLKPGESIPLDLVPLSPTVTMPYTQCGVRATTLRVGLDYWPRAQDDRRLVATDLWLIDRLPDGTERSQLLSLRGLFNQPTPFYFDTVVDGVVSVDFFGEFIITPGSDAVSLKLSTRSRLTQGGVSSTSMPADNASIRGLMTSREVESTLRLTPTDVVAVQLPRLTENGAGAFSNRAFSIRVRSRQIR